MPDPCVPLAALLFGLRCLARSGKCIRHQVLAFDPRFGVDTARQYAGKYCSKPEKWHRAWLLQRCCDAGCVSPFCAPAFHAPRWYYLEAEKKDSNNALKDFLKARTVPMRSKIALAQRVGALQSM